MIRRSHGGATAQHAARLLLQNRHDSYVGFRNPLKATVSKNVLTPPTIPAKWAQVAQGVRAMLPMRLRALGLPAHAIDRGSNTSEGRLQFEPESCRSI